MKCIKEIGVVAMFALLQVLSPNHIKAAIDEDLLFIAKENAFGINDYNSKCDVNEDGNINVFDVIRIKQEMLSGTDTIEGISSELEQVDNKQYDTPAIKSNDVDSGLFDVFALKPIDGEQYRESTASSWWASEYHYKAGYVESIRLNPNSGAIPSIIIVDAAEEKVVFKGTAVNNIVEVKQLIEHDFYVLVKGVKFDTMTTQWSRFYEDKYYPDTLELGSSFTPKFRDCGYIFAVEITYKNVNKDSLVLKKENDSKMFVAGDSITAGYPYMADCEPYALNEDIRWGRQVARRLGYDVTFGASNGNGWVYSTGSANAYTITRDTDFSQYDLVVYAWGTNDYGNNSPLGTINDDYHDVVTVYSRVKYCIEKVYSDNPKAVMVIVLPINRKTGNIDDNYAYGTKNSAAEPYTLSELCEAIKSTCEMYGVPYIDNRVSAFNRFSLDGLLLDGLHPNEKGYQILGAHLTGEIGRIVSPYYPNALTEGNLLD